MATLFTTQSINPVLSSSSGSFTTTSGSFTTVTNLSMSVQVDSGSVFIGLQPAPGSNGALSQNYQIASGTFDNGAIQCRLLRDGTPIATFSLQDCGLYNGGGGTIDTTFGISPSSIWCIDQNPTPGSHTYSFQTTNTAGGGNTANVIDCVLVAIPFNG